MKREKHIKRISDNTITWDIVVVGGGATGIGIALDAASRGFKTVLLEQADFTKATSSRSTKLVHGGVRYLAQGDVALVVDALHERGLMRKNAPHLVKDQRFIIGTYRWWEKAFYTIGLTMYDVLAGHRSFGRSLPMRKKDVIREIPGISTKGLRGGVVYHDGQFDDSRMGINLLQTAEEQGAVVVNYIKVTALIKDPNGKIAGVEALDELSGQAYRLKSKAVINATGIFVDDLMQMDAPEKENIVRPSQGVHLVVDKSFLGGDTAIMIPKTSDGRVMFGVPWHDKVVLGTTDTPMNEFVLEPKALEEEVDFILKTSGQYLTKQPKREDVLSVFAGLRPLAAPKKSSNGKKTKEISRSHKIVTSPSGLVTITGGKWTTYRDMAEDAVNRAIAVCGLKNVPCKTEHLHIHGYQKKVDRSNYSYVYGSDYSRIQEIEKEALGNADKLHPNYDYTVAEVIWAVREEMAITLEDVLSRRLRITFLDARVAIDMAPKAATAMAKEMGKEAAWIQEQISEFVSLAQNYLLVPYNP
ncbi:MAG: glycerol-3-phosphate dehydrogenase/oxidase [Massilibacteroides sp.]|nr:glycerol-3-phosphate dehydrogenase/oxidase [Massilibacteroides sp.]MDD3061947.1 glycerol-3-phosphate dehydrogenase/oxidase [Massilibacteroides sp.]MDD4115758.1 glycerol-3-phosphate dehydrogenase/oxidase [Massilibacteroides sp.]MDD4659924.1 glycerol-3-phosphate dehydrogenase/oxidase [Massilibacteroides sp.]